MKSSGSGRKKGRYAKCLIVDGYNLLPKVMRVGLSEIDDLRESRDHLIASLSEYGSFSGEDVILVFDAHLQARMAVTETLAGVIVMFTDHGETADERIEHLVYENRDVYGQITVVTSDYAEQQVVFGGGALRISSSEMARRLRDARGVISRKVEERDDREKMRLGDIIRQDIANTLEKWRRQ